MREEKALSVLFLHFCPSALMDKFGPLEDRWNGREQGTRHVKSRQNNTYEIIN